ncbi:hypothetical protein LFM09_19230 [Lentzea alba]|uniref:hypothetical protein n=1 Tax=Lentzea alba TaxID=2714351 RepID=UPI0039BF101C
MPEHPTVSIDVSIASQVASGLHALVAKHLSAARAKEAPRRSGDTYVNKVSGTVDGTVIQIGRMHGNVNDNRGR